MMRTSLSRGDGNDNNSSQESIEFNVSTHGDGSPVETPFRRKSISSSRSLQRSPHGDNGVHQEAERSLSPTANVDKARPSPDPADSPPLPGGAFRRMRYIPALSTADDDTYTQKHVHTPNVPLKSIGSPNNSFNLRIEEVGLRAACISPLTRSAGEENSQLAPKVIENLPKSTQPTSPKGRPLDGPNSLPLQKIPPRNLSPHGRQILEMNDGKMGDSAVRPQPRCLSPKGKAIVDTHDAKNGQLNQRPARTRCVSPKGRGLPDLLEPLHCPEGSLAGNSGVMKSSSPQSGKSHERNRSLSPIGRSVSSKSDECHLSGTFKSGLEQSDETQPSNVRVPGGVFRRKKGGPPARIRSCETDQDKDWDAAILCLDPGADQIERTTSWGEISTSDESSRPSSGHQRNLAPLQQSGSSQNILKGVSRLGSGSFRDDKMSECQQEANIEFEKIIQDLKEQIKRLEEEIRHKSTALDNVTSKLQDAIQKIQELESVVSESHMKPSNAPVSEQIRDMEKKLALSKHQMAKMMAMADKEATQLKAEISRLKGQLEAVNQETDLAKWVAICDEAKINEMKALELAKSLNQRIQENNVTITQLRDQIDDREYEISRLKDQCTALASVMAVQRQQVDKSKTGQESPKSTLVLAPTRSTGIQTESKESWRKWVTLLAYLLVLSNEKASTVDHGTDVQERGIGMCDADTITSPLLLRSQTEDERFMTQILERAENEIKVLNIRGTRMPTPKLLSLISTLYSRKIYEDEIDDREGLPRQEFVIFVLGHFCMETGSCSAAQYEFVNLLANVLIHLRATPLNNSDAAKVAISKALHPKATERIHVHPRIATFARFLGLRHENLDPIPLEGLNLFLSVLVQAQKGSIPLLPVTGPPVMANTPQFTRAIQIAFCNCPHVVQDAIKIELQDMQFDIDQALEYIVGQWAEIKKKWTARLSALLASIDRNEDGNIDFEAFQEIMHRLALEKKYPTFRTRIRMFTRICTYPRVDSTILVQECDNSAFGGFVLGDCKELSKDCMDSIFTDEEEKEEDVNEQEILDIFKTLTPQYKYLQGTVGKTAKDMEAEGIENELILRWNILEKMMEEQSDPCLASAFYNSIARQHAGMLSDGFELPKDLGSETDRSERSAGGDRTPPTFESSHKPPSSYAAPRLAGRLPIVGHSSAGDVRVRRSSHCADDSPAQASKSNLSISKTFSVRPLRAALSSDTGGEGPAASGRLGEDRPAVRKKSISGSSGTYGEEHFKGIL